MQGCKSVAGLTKRSSSFFRQPDTSSFFVRSSVSDVRRFHGNYVIQTARHGSTPALVKDALLRHIAHISLLHCHGEQLMGLRNVVLKLCTMGATAAMAVFHSCTPREASRCLRQAAASLKRQSSTTLLSSLPRTSQRRGSSLTSTQGRLPNFGVRDESKLTLRRGS